MSRHLNEDQISAIVAGGHNQEIAAHVENCAPCRQKVERLENVLGHFRGAVREWGDMQFAGRAVVQPRTRFWPALAYGWAVAFIVLLSVIGYRFSTRPGVNAVVAPSALQSDTLLLNHVKADVSRSVPPGMETLLGFSVTETEQR
jgi:hypothetical protein